MVGACLEPLLDARCEILWRLCLIALWIKCFNYPLPARYSDKVVDAPSCVKMRETNYLFLRLFGSFPTFEVTVASFAELRSLGYLARILVGLQHVLGCFHSSGEVGAEDGVKCDITQRLSGGLRLTSAHVR